ncbi:MAG: 3-dehydroquinate synthase II [Candidatus Thalassarchaeaceae archaeon]|jgi:3-dehydroquinate synthase II|nr:3-dehydroquinate synthase II [Candidatus Thalassarchaeaceae archaeon]
MELWLDAASGKGGTLNPHPADRVLLAAGDRIPDWIDSALFACEDGRILDSSTAPVGVHVDISDAEGQDAAKSMVGLVSWIVLTTGNWQMIPLENIVAAAQGTGTHLVARINTSQAIRGAAFALETGVDGLLLPANQAEIWADAQIIAAERLAVQSEGDEGALEDDSEITTVEIQSIEDGGVGDRVCVDLTSILEVGEGLLIGSSANALMLVHGETLESQFVPPRPFRVNAGAVHAYVLMADGSTKYLSELLAGDSVAVCNSTGVSRNAVIGRMKIESRPFLLIRYTHSESGITGQIFLQQAETVRLISPLGDMPSVTSVEVGDMLLGFIGTSARHIGQNVLSISEER